MCALDGLGHLIHVIAAILNPLPDRILQGLEPRDVPRRPVEEDGVLVMHLRPGPDPELGQRDTEYRRRHLDLPRGALGSEFEIVQGRRLVVVSGRVHGVGDDVTCVRGSESLEVLVKRADVGGACAGH